MTLRATPRMLVPPWGLAVAAMLSVQLGSALSMSLISTIGPAGTAWLRLSMGALILLALARPPLRAVRPRDVPALLGLGISTGVTTIAFLAAGAPDGPVVVGDVAPLSTRALAPIPAGEPIVLVARAPDGAEYRLAPRSFEPDAAWSWVIPPDAPFRRPRPGGGPP